MRKYGSPKIITTDKLATYRAVFHEIGVAERQLGSGRTNNRCENLHLPFRRRERAMQNFKKLRDVAKFYIVKQPNLQSFQSRKTPRN